MSYLYICSVKSAPLYSNYFAYCLTLNKILSAKGLPIAYQKFGAPYFHTSSTLDIFAPRLPRPTVFKKPVDWLPFPWHRRPRFNLYEDGGDRIKEIPTDPNALKPDFEFSEELKTANETVRRTFSLATASKDERKERMKRDLLQRIQRHPFDFDSAEVKIALRTVQIRSLYEHHSMLWRKDSHFSRRVLPILIQRRNAELHRLQTIDEARFNWLVKELDLSFTPPTLGLKTDKYCKKWDLRRLTKEYCEKMIASKKEAYHEELKKEQEAFLKEKEEILAWIEAEEKALNLDTVQ